MSFDIKYPHITSQSEAGKIEQIRAYLYQLADQLKWALNSIEKGGANSLQATSSSNSVEAYFEEISRKFAGEYVAKSVFGDYLKLIEQSITTNSKCVEVAEDCELDVKGVLRVNHIASIDSYSNKDFNELIYQTGYYTGISDPSSVSATNYPIDETGMLEVISVMAQDKETLAWWGFAYQTYRTHTGYVYMRSYYSTTGWTGWKKVTLT